MQRPLNIGVEQPGFKNYKSIVYSFSLAAALLLPIKRLIEVKDLPTHRDSATLHSGVTDRYVCNKINSCDQYYINLNNI